eukprot:TRINITY_DN10328_c0_g1_i1.p1 TRINITY_DN10328_c0_g1~~TRINITY_DN10328_c0_g1_i1.p1  ORF type:complete len:173 (-),score=30.60 TRINITY_DN10328_c0_g1_i1:14-532(-)
MMFPMLFGMSLTSRNIHITDSKSFLNLDKYVDLLHEENEPGSVKIMLIGAKLDLVQDNVHIRDVSVEKARMYATKINASHHLETSSRSGMYINQVFDLLGISLFGMESGPHTQILPRSGSSAKRANVVDNAGTSGASEMQAEIKVQRRNAVPRESLVLTISGDDKKSKRCCK